MKKRRVLVVVLLFTFLMVTTAYAAEKTYDLTKEGVTIGTAQLRVNVSSSMRDCYAKTYPRDQNTAYLKVVTTYDDGSEYVYESDKVKGCIEYRTDYEWSEDYRSTHRVWTTYNEFFAEAIMSGDGSRVNLVSSR